MQMEGELPLGAPLFNAWAELATLRSIQAKEWGASRRSPMLPDAMATGGRLSPDHAYPVTGVGLSSEGVEAFEVTTIEATKVAANIGLAECLA